jgi:hypothetical protein
MLEYMFLMPAIGPHRHDIILHTCPHHRQWAKVMSVKRLQGMTKVRRAPGRVECPLEEARRRSSDLRATRETNIAHLEFAVLRNEKVNDIVGGASSLQKSRGVEYETETKGWLGTT